MTVSTQNQNQTQTAEPAQTAENLETLIEHSEEITGTSVWGYLIWGLALPPISTILALLWAIRRGVIFVVLPSVTIAFSMLALISPVLVYFLFGPIRVVTTQFAISQNVYADTKLTLTSILLILVALAGIILGIYFRRQAKHKLTIGPVAMAILIVILALEHVIFLMNLSSAASVISKQTQILLNGQGIPY